MIIKISLIFLFVNTNLIYCSPIYQKVKLIENYVITLNHNNNTLGSKPIRQLSCVGDKLLCDEYSPEIVQCFYKGIDGFDILWSCKASLSKKVKFENTKVKCIRYNYLNDTHIVPESCYLKYSLIYNLVEESDSYTGFIISLVSFWFIFVALLIFTLIFLSNIQNYCLAKSDRPITQVKKNLNKKNWPDNPPSYQECINLNYFKNYSKLNHSANNYESTVIKNFK